MEQMDCMLNRDDDHRPYRSEPTFDMSAPARKFAIELTLEHPYWHSFRKELNAPDFNSFHPDVDDYLREYDDEVNGLHELAAALLHIMDANGSETWEDEAVPAA